VFSTEIFNHGGRHGNVMGALAQWRHPVACIEARDVLHRAMCPTLHRPICMAIEIASDLPVFFVVADSLLPTNMLNNIVIVNLN
jgi:hypothetical protein